MDRKRNSLKYTFILLPLLASCGGATGGGSVTINGGITFPDCTDGQLLVTDDSGVPQCASAPGGTVNVPSACTANQALNTTDGVNLLCVEKAMGGNTNPLNDKLTTLKTKLDDLTTKATNIKNGTGTGGGFLRYLGNSTESLTGHLKSKGDTMLGLGVLDNGMVAAAKFCDKKFPGKNARMCTVNDMYWSVLQGDLKRDGLQTADAWVYHVTFENPLAGTVQSGLNDNCAGYSYETADAKWQGLAVQWRQSDTSLAGKGDVSLNFYLRGCNTSRAIACCGTK